MNRNKFKMNAKEMKYMIMSTIREELSYIENIIILFGLLTISILLSILRENSRYFPDVAGPGPYLPLCLLLFDIFVRQKTLERVNTDEADGMFRFYGYFDTVTNLSKCLGNLDINHTSRTRASPGWPFCLL